MSAALTLVEDEPTAGGRFSARRWPSWPPPEAKAYSRAAAAHSDDQANLRFTVPDGAWGAAPAWRSRTHYVAALRWHPRLADVCRRREVAVETFLIAMALYATRGDVDTGRNIAVSNAVIGRLLHCSGRHVRNITAAARDLGVLHIALAGTSMSIDQRGQVLDQYRRGHPSRRWRNLPNFAAAIVPAELVRALHRPLRELRARLAAGEAAARAAVSHWRACRLFRTGPLAPRTWSETAPVDNSRTRDAIQLAFFHLPQSGNQAAGTETFYPYETSLFQPGCGQTPTERAEQARRAAAARPTHPRAKRRTAPLLNPDLKAYARAFRARLPGFEQVSVARIANALSPYRSSGLSPVDLAAGLRAYLIARRQTLYRTWEPYESEQQARYLVATLKRARCAGYLVAGST